MRTLAILFCVAIGTITGLAQPVFTGTEIFPPEEFAARRANVMAAIGDGVAILQGTTERPGEQAFRQNNQFFYLTGVVEPRAIAVIDGRTKKTTIFLQPFSDRREGRMYGPALHPGEDAARALGVDAVLAREEFGKLLPDLLRGGRTIYTPFRPEVLGEASSSDPRALANATKNDPWDGRISREEQFIQKLKAVAAASETKDLDPILDRLRDIKSAREITLIREATRITGLAIMEAMRDAKPGMHEYELQAVAEYVFKKHGAQGAAYFALVATGKNTIFSHYHRGMAQLADGDLVQFDYAPDYKYYVSDVTRVFPANGKFTAWQREYYTSYLRLYQALMTSVRPNVPVREIIADAVKKMDGVLSTFKFTDPKIQQAATQFVGRYHKSTANSLGHTIGMEVHDVTRRGDTLVPGQLFTIEPAMQIPDLGLGLRLEDAILMTETGYESLSVSVPVEVEAIEKVMAERGTSVPRRDAGRQP